MKFLTYIPSESDANNFGVNITLFKKNLDIATKYYSTIFKMIPLGVTYSFGSTCGSIPVPESARQISFSDYDIVILTRFFN